MKIEDQVVSIKLAMKLRDFWKDHKPYFYWINSGSEPRVGHIDDMDEKRFGDHHRPIDVLRDEEEPSGDLLSDCCKAEFNPWGYEKEEGIWQERCLKCGELCEPIWVESNKK